MVDGEIKGLFFNLIFTFNNSYFISLSLEANMRAFALLLIVQIMGFKHSRDSFLINLSGFAYKVKAEKNETKSDHFEHYNEILEITPF